MCSYIKFALKFLEMFQVLMIHNTLWNRKGQGCMFAWRPEEQKLYEFWPRGHDRSQRSRFLQGLTQKSQDFTDFWSIWKYLHLQRCSIELKWVANRLPVGIFELRQCPAWGPEGCQSNCKCICEDMHRQTRDKQPNIYRKNHRWKLSVMSEEGSTEFLAWENILVGWSWVRGAGGWELRRFVVPFQIVANCTQQKYMTTSLLKGHVQVRHGKIVPGNKLERRLSTVYRFVHKSLTFSPCRSGSKVSFLCS